MDKDEAEDYYFGDDFYKSILALCGCEHGMRTLYLGCGVGSGEDSLFKFKRAFYRGELNRLYIGKKVFDADTYRKLTTMRGNAIENANYFPEYQG